ncbi:MAG: hypothetical protein ACRDBF_07275 [Plesiomonas shigelloides]
MLIALLITAIVFSLVALLFVATCQQVESIIPRASELGAWDRDLESARALRDLAAHCKAARGVRENG